MKFTHRVQYPRTVEEILQMLRDPRFHALRDAQLHAVTEPVQEVDDGFVIRSSAQVDLDRLPSPARKFAKSAPQVTIEEKWDADEASAHTVVKVASFPVSVDFDSQLLPTEEGCERRLEGDVNVRIPLVGAKLEKQALAHLDRINEVEDVCVRQYWEQLEMGGNHE